MKKTNVKLREQMQKLHVPVWAVADVIGVHENTLLRRLRKELPENDRAHLMQIVEQIAVEDEGKEGGADA